MTAIIEFLHYFSIAFVTGASSVAVGIGEGLVGLSAMKALNIQPQAKDDIQKLVILGMALVETAAIIGVSMAFIIIFGVSQADKTIYLALSELGIAFAIGISGFTIGIVSAMPAKAACLAIARQPFLGNKILRFMLISQSMIQTPIIFSFIVAMLIKAFSSSATTMAQSLTLIASGLAIGLGCVGPAIGLGEFGKTACQSIGINRKAYGKIFTFMLISSAIIETPIIFALMVSMVIITSSAPTLLIGIAMVSSAFCIGIGTFGPGLSAGRIASSACKQIAKDPEIYSSMSKVSIFAQSVSGTAAIYALMISMVLILFAK
ncbi:hypothetical protein ACFLYA_02680 [Candidatus Dependentiae bacterium]